jgi:NADH-quinone oxidoreductase subunit A
MIWPLLTYFVLVVVLVAAILLVSYLLGQRHSEPATGEPYEGGIVSEGSARFDTLLPGCHVFRDL